MRTYIKQLVDLVSSNFRPGMIVCEVGVRRGDTLRHYAPIVKAAGGQVIAVDWFCGSADVHDDCSWDDHRVDAESRARRRQEFMRVSGIAEACDGNPNSDWMFLLEGDSAEMANCVANGCLDICFLDADHTYAGVKRDIAAWSLKVRVGGLLCGDDCEDLQLAGSFTEEELSKHYVEKNGKFVHPGVIQAVSDTFKNAPVTIIPGPSWTPTPIWVVQRLY